MLRPATTRWAGIAKLQEEMGELAAVLGKLHAYPDGEHPDQQVGAPPLLDRLHDEMADVHAALTFFMLTNHLDSARLRQRSDEKLARFFEWHAAEGMTGTR